MNLKKGDIIARRYDVTAMNFAQVLTDGNYDLSNYLECFVFRLEGRPHRIVNDTILGDPNMLSIDIYLESGLSDDEMDHLQRILNHYFEQIRVGLKVNLWPIEAKYDNDYYYTIRWLNVEGDRMDVNAGINGKYEEASKDIFIYKPIGARKERFFTVLAHEILHILNLTDVGFEGNIMNLSFVLNSIFISTAQLIQSAGLPLTSVVYNNSIELPTDDSLLDYSIEQSENEI